MENQDNQKVRAGSDSKVDSQPAEAQGKSLFDPLKLMGDAGKALKDAGSKSVEAFGTPQLVLHDGQKPAVDTVAAKAADKMPVKGPIADQVISKIKDSTNPVQDIKGALQKLDNLRDASVTRNGNSSHIDVNLMHGQTSAPPNIQVRGFRPVASHTDSHLSFDLQKANGGVMLSNMEGFSSTVQGPLGRMRHSETTSLFIGKDSAGRPYVNSNADLYMRRRVHSSTTTLREENFPADSPMRSAMQHPEALDNIGKTLTMFQNTDDLKNLGIKRQGDGFDLKSESKSAKHVDLNYEFKPDKLPITVKVGSMDLDKSLSASLTQEKDSVTLGKISGLKMNVEIAGAKVSLCPTKVSIEKDNVKMELKNPDGGDVIPVSIPIAKLKEAAAKQR